MAYNEIYIITARSNKFYKNAYEFCNNYLNKNEIYFDKLIIGQNHKLNVCKDENILLMIDDSIDTCEKLEDNGINSLVFNSIVNSEKNTNCNRVNNWLEVYDYIKELEHKKVMLLDKN